MMNKRFLRDLLYLCFSLLLFFLYVPHLCCFIIKREYIINDLKAIEHQLNIKLPIVLQLLYQLHNNPYFRNTFYFRIGPLLGLLIGWYRPGNKSFCIPYSTKIGKGLKYAHPYSTMLNAESIGDNFSCIHCTTIGKKDGSRPRIGNNVVVGCHVVIIGNISIGDNVVIGAGSVVVKDVPNNCIVAGNPAKIIKTMPTVEPIVQ